MEQFNNVYRLASAYTIIPMYRLADLTDSHTLISVCKYILYQNKGGPIKNTLLTKTIKITKFQILGVRLNLKFDHGIQIRSPKVQIRSPIA